MSSELQLTVQRFVGLRAILVAVDGSTIETIAARLPLGARQGSMVRVPAQRGRPDWAQAVLNHIKA